jgi:hypothetical protein
MFHATHGDHKGGVSVNQDGRVDNPILFGPHQFLAVQNQDQLDGFIHDLQLRHRPTLARLDHLDQAFAQGLIQEKIFYARAIRGEDRVKGQIRSQGPNFFSEKCAFSGNFLERRSGQIPSGGLDVIK